MNFPAELKYTAEHEWVKVEGNVVTVGITDYAQSELGDIVFVDIDEDAGDVGTGDSLGTIEAVKTVSDLFAPIAGKVVEVNEKLADEPQLANTDPYGEGWFVKMEIENENEYNELMDQEAYKQSIGQ